MSEARMPISSSCLPPARHCSTANESKTGTRQWIRQWVRYGMWYRTCHREWTRTPWRTARYNFWPLLTVPSRRVRRIPFPSLRPTRVIWMQTTRMAPLLTATARDTWLLSQSTPPRNWTASHSAHWREKLGAAPSTMRMLKQSTTDQMRSKCRMDPQEGRS